jgi:hypothetical protein
MPRTHHPSAPRNRTSPWRSSCPDPSPCHRLPTTGRSSPSRKLQQPSASVGRLHTASPVSSSRLALGSRASGSAVGALSFHGPLWSAGRMRILRPRTTLRDAPKAPNRSPRRRHRSRICRRDPYRRSNRMGRARPPLRITERSQQIRDGINAHACQRSQPQQGHMRSSPSDASFRWPSRRRHDAYRARPLRHHPLPAARPAQAHTSAHAPSARCRSAASSSATRGPETRPTDRAAVAARRRLTDMRASSRRQQPNNPMELHELASVMAARLLPSAVPGPVRPCPVNRDTESYAC